ncbi:MAG: helix-turn-helix domain containing protein [Candidatus Desulfofervidus auxilii]|nr:helix-turn-helix domain containing protein [Candidatus Desulfofervidus auxilii]
MKEVGKKEFRQQMVKDVLKENISAVACKYGCSRNMVRKWVQRVSLEKRSGGEGN